MARRVNKKFVLLLVLGLLIPVGIVAGLALRKYQREHNPDYLLDMARKTLPEVKKADQDVVKAEQELRKAEQEGRKADVEGRRADLEKRKAEQGKLLDEVFRLVGKATPILSARADARAAEMWTWQGNLLYEYSGADTRRYTGALGCWQKALVASPRYKPALELLTREYYSLALGMSARGDDQRWKDLEREAGRLLALDPAYGLAYLYRADAMRQARGTRSEAEVRAQARKDLEQARKLMPADSRPVVGIATLLLEEAALLERGRVAEQDQARKLQADVDALLQDFCRQNPTSVEAHVAAGNVLMGEARRLEGLGQRLLAAQRVAEAAVRYEQAVKIGPQDPMGYVALADFYWGQQDWAKVEENLNKARDRRGSQEDYQRLGLYYQRVPGPQGRRTDEALAAYANALAQPKTGVGLDAWRHEQGVRNIKRVMCELKMEKLEMAGRQTAEGKALEAEVEQAFNQLRGEGQRGQGLEPWVYLLEGRKLLIQDKPYEAIVALRKSNDFYGSEPRNPLWLETKWRLSVAYQRTGDLGKAREFNGQILAQNPRHLPAIVMRARLLLDLKQWDEALRAANAAVELAPDNEEYKRLQAAAYIGKGDRTKAGAILEQTGTPVAMRAFARILLLQEDEEQAEAVLKKVLAKQPDDRETILLTVQMHWQVAARAREAAAQAREQNEKQKEQEKQAEDVQRRQAARELLTAALAKHPEAGEYKLWLARLDKPELKVTELQRMAIDDIKDEADRGAALGYWHLRQGQTKEALAEFQKASEKRNNQDKELVQRVFDVSLSLKDWVRAAAYAQHGERLNLDGMNGKLLLGELQMAKGETAAGLATLELARSQRPDHALGHTFLGRAYLQLGRIQQARDEFKTALELSPNDVQALKGMIQLHLGLGDAPNVAEAQKYLKAARVFAPQDPWLAMLNDRLGPPEEGIQRWERVLAANPKNDQVKLELAQQYRRAKQYPKAIKLVEEVQQEKADDVLVGEFLARLYQEAQQPQEAQKIYEKLGGNKDPQVKFAALLNLANMYRETNNLPGAVRALESAIKAQPPDTTEGQRRLADLYFDASKFAEAEAAYRTVHDVEKDAEVKARVLRRYVETLMLQAKYREAEDWLQNKVLKDRPQDTEALVLLGSMRMQERKLKEAMDAYNRVLAVQKDHPAALYHRALAQLQLQADLAQAVKDLERLRELYPQMFSARLLLAKVYRTQRQHADAVREYQEVLKQAPNHAGVRLEYGEYLLALARMAGQLPKDARDDFATVLRTLAPAEKLDAMLEEVLTKDQDAPPELRPVWLVLRGDLEEIRGNRGRALQLHRQAYELSPDGLRMVDAYLRTLAARKNWDETIAVTTQVIARHKDWAGVYVRRGTAFAGQRKTAEALADFDTALDAAKDNLAAFLAVIEQLYGAWPQEVSADVLTQHLQGRLEKNPESVGTRIGLAQALLKAGRYQDVAPALAPLAAEAAKEPKLKVLMLRMQGLACYQDGQYAAALKHYDELRQIAPADLEALNNSAYILAENLNRPKDGLDLAERAMKVLQREQGLQVYVNNGNVLDTHGWVLFLNGRWNEAEMELRRSAQLEPLPATYYHWARALQKLNKLPEAKGAVQDCLRVGPTDPIAPKARQLLAELSK